MDWSLVPRAVRDLVEELSEYSGEEWKQEITNWTPLNAELVRYYRQLGEHYRQTSLRERRAVFERIAEDRDCGLTLALICLTDETLDRIIANLPQIQ